MHKWALGIHYTYIRSFIRMYGCLLIFDTKTTEWILFIGAQIVYDHYTLAKTISVLAGLLCY